MTPVIVQYFDQYPNLWIKGVPGPMTAAGPRVETLGRLCLGLTFVAGNAAAQPPGCRINLLLEGHDEREDGHKDRRDSETARPPVPCRLTPFFSGFCSFFFRASHCAA